MNVRSRRFALDLTSVIFGLLLGLATIGYVQSQAVSGSVNLTIGPSTAKNDVTVTWQVDGYPVGKVSAAPITFFWDSTKFIDGLHTITTITTSSDGSQTVSTIAALYTQNGVSAKTVYLDPTNGIDTNTCLDPSQACRTFEKANSFIYHGGDSILLKAGSNMSIDSATLATELTLLGPNSTLGKQNAYGNGQPITISTYGGSDNCNPLARITTDCATVTLTGNAMTPRTGMINGVNVPNVFVKNLRLVGSQPNALCANCGYGLNFGAAGNFANPNGPHIQNNEVIDFNVGIYVANTLGQLYATIGTVWNASIQDNYVHGLIATSTITSGIHGQGLVNPVVQGNLVENTGGFPGSGSGIVFTSGGTGVIDQFNVTRYGGANNTACGGPFGNWVYQVKNPTLRFNETYKFGPAVYAGGCDMGGFDLDGGVSGALLEYNYSHDNVGPGLVMLGFAVGSYPWGNNTVRYNISENDNQISTDGTGSPAGYGLGKPTALPLYFYNNTIWNGLPGTKRSDGRIINSAVFSITGQCPTAGSVIANNIFAGKANGNLVTYYFGGDLNCQGLTTFAANDWYAITGNAAQWNRVNNHTTAFTSLAAWQAGIGGGDIGATTANPLFAGNGGTGGTCHSYNIPLAPQTRPTGCSAVYKLQPGSPLIGAGIDLRKPPFNLDVGSHDYWGNPIPHNVGTGFNIGADGGLH